MSVANASAARFTVAVLSGLRVIPNAAGERLPSSGFLPGGGNPSIVFVHHPRARRYILRLRPDGTARVTIPRGGSTAAAREFVFRQSAWIQTQRERLKASPPRPSVWRHGSEFLFRGEPVRIETGTNGDTGLVRFGAETLRVKDAEMDLRPAIERHLRKLAARELPLRLLEHARALQLPARRVTVRNQRTRWGSCSCRGTISLNWRLIQTPPFVCDYLCLHELMHLREMNHSARFWREVEAACPDYQAAERWLKAHARLLG